METLPLPFSPRFTLFCEGAESEHQRTMKKNNNMAEGEYDYLFLAVRVEVGSEGSVDQMCLMDANTAKTKIFGYDLRKSCGARLCDDFESVVGLGRPKVIICHNLPEVLPVMRKARFNFDNVAGFSSLQWCLPLEEIKVQMCHIFEIFSTENLHLIFSNENVNVLYHNVSRSYRGSPTGATSSASG